MDELKKQYNQDISDTSVFQGSNGASDLVCNIMAIGVGGGGNNAVNHMYVQGIKNVSFVNINTDHQTLCHSQVPHTLEIGDGLGAGNKPEKARDFAEESADEIAALFDDQTKMVFITAGMGGGTGTGAAPVVARIAKERGLLTIGIVTIPFLFEGQKKIKKAIAGADEMAKHVDALLVINNERLGEIYGDLDFLNAFGKADDTLSIAARSISELITCNGLINLDFNDVDTTLRDGGAAITDFIGSINTDVDVIWGVGFDETLGNGVKMTILAAGFDVSLREEEDGLMENGGGFVFGGRPGNRPATTAPGARTAPAAAPAPAAPKPAPKAPEVSDERLAEEYGITKIKDLTEGKDRSSTIILGLNQLDDDAICDILEKHPTYKRDRKIVEDVRNGAVDTAATVTSPTRNSSTQFIFG